MKTKAEARAHVFAGLGVSAGVAIGRAHVTTGGQTEVAHRTLGAEDVAGELARFAQALAKSQRQIAKLRMKLDKLPPAAAEELSFLLEAHRQMLQDSRLVRGARERIARERLNAEAAVHMELAEIAKDFAHVSDEYLAARARDIRDVGERLIRNLTETPYQGFSALPEGSILVADDLSPADTALMDPRRIAGFATVLGGAEGHTAIMARSLGLPAVLGATGLIQGVRTGDLVIVDGAAGRVIVNPSRETLTAYERRRDELERERRQLAHLKNLPAVTRDGVAVSLMANLDLPRELDAALEAGAAGVGLLRTEFLFMNRDDLPGEDEQFRMIASVVAGMRGLPVTVRTLDLGGEKLATPVTGQQGMNPALGLRAIRLALKEPELLRAQIAATLRAGAHGPVRLLLPMVTTVSEVRQVREMVKLVARRLKRRKIAIADPLPPLGVMIEIPGAALTSDALALACDFFAVGTNDLTMYTLAIDRADERVAHLYNPLHPAVLRLIQFATEAALRARIPVSLCGEMAGDPRYSALLLGLGIRELSMTPGALLRVKQRVRSLDLTAATQRARLIMDQSDTGRIAALLDDFNALA